MRKLIHAAAAACIALLIIPFPIPANAADWAVIGTGNGITFEAKSGTAKRAETEENEPIVLFEARITTPTEVTFVMFYVRTVECKLGSGRLATTNMQGKVLMNTPFVLQGKNLSAHVAELLCGLDDRLPPAPDQNSPRSVEGQQEI